MIKIEIRKAVRQPGTNTAFLLFDHYDKELVDALSFISMKCYNKNTKEWEFPISMLERLVKMYQKFDIRIIIPRQKVSHNTIPANYVFKTKPYQHQIEGIEYGLNHNAWILGDDQGLGKTKQIIDLVEILKLEGKLKQCLIICGVSSLRYNWQDEVGVHSNDSCFVLGTRYKKNGKSYCATIPERVEDLKTHKETFLITNAETLLNKDFITELNKRKDDINLIAVDEAHKVASVSSHRGDALTKLENFDYKIAMTGTPLRNSPLDAYVPLKWRGYEKSTYGTFKKFYDDKRTDEVTGVKEFLGYRHLDILKEQLDGCMLRRLKEDVLDLPPKVHSIRYVEMNNAQAKIYEECEDWVFENIDMICSSPNPLSMLIRLRQATGYTGILSSTIHESAKLDELERDIAEVVANGGKMIIFSNWEKITAEAKRRLEKYNPAYAAGTEISGDAIKQEVDKFQKDDTCKCIIGTLGKIGTGFTLTAGQEVRFLDDPWSPAEKAQNEDRAHRIGTRGTVNIVTYVTKGTIDETIENIIYKKRLLIGQLVKMPPERKKNIILDLIQRAPK